MKRFLLIGLLLMAAPLWSDEPAADRPPPTDIPLEGSDPAPGAHTAVKKEGAEGSPIVKALRGALGLGPQQPRPIPVSPELKAEIDRAIFDLAADDYHVREAAAQHLIEIGPPALASLQQASSHTDAEVRFRAGQLFAIVQSGVISDSRVLTGHEDIVWTVAFSNTGRLLASGGGGRHDNGQWFPGSDFAIRIWDPATGTVVRTIEGHTSTINRVVWSMSDRYLLSASSDGTARIWRAKDGSEFRIFRGHDGSVTQALFSPDEKQVITCGWDKTIRIWDVVKGKEIRHIDWPYGHVWGLALSPDGELIAVCGDDPVIRLFRFSDGKPAGELTGHGGNAVTVAFSLDGAQLASGGWDNSARIWNVKDRRQLHLLSDHTNRVEGLAWSPDGTQLVTGCLDNKVRVFDAAKGTVVRIYEGHTEAIAKVAVSPQGDSVASAGWDSSIRLWPTTGAVAAVGPAAAPAPVMRAVPMMMPLRFRPFDLPR